MLKQYDQLKTKSKMIKRIIMMMQDFDNSSILVYCDKTTHKNFGPYVLSGGPLIFNVILFKRKAVYTEGAGPVCKCTGQCTLEGCILLF